MIKKIQEALRKKKVAKTIQEYYDQVEMQPNDTRTRLKLGDLLAKSGRREESIDQYMLSAKIFSEAGFHLKSIALYKQVLKLDPDSREALRRGAQVSFQHGIYADSFPYYEKLADFLRKDDENQRCVEIYEELRSLSLGDTKRKVQVFEAVFPGAGEEFSDPYERLLAIGKEMIKEGAGLPDARALASWIREAYPDKMEGHELLISLLSAEEDESLPEALDQLEELYRRKGKLEAGAKFLQEHRKAVPAAETETESEEDGLRPHAGDDADLVKVKLDGNIYELLKKKAQQKRAPGPEGSDEAEAGDEGGTPLERLKFDDLFENFKESIEGQVAQDDSETHYNLGVAYFEMELFEDAMNEFEVASRNPNFQSDAFFMMGNCSKSLDRLDDALAQYEKALGGGGITIERACAIRYEQALTHRAAGRDDKALELFQEIRKRASDYRDLDDQIRDLGGEIEEEETAGDT